MRRYLFGLLAFAFAGLLLACGSDDGGDGGGNNHDGPSGGGQSSDSNDRGNGKFRFLALNFGGIDDVEPDGGDPEPVIVFTDYGLSFGETPFPVKLIDDDIWFSRGPGQLTSVDLDSGDATELTFASTQQVTDYYLVGDLIWVEVGFAYADAVLLGIDRASGETKFTLTPPEGVRYADFSVGATGLWVIGGDPETVAAVSHVDPATGSVLGIHDVGLVVKEVLAASNSVWAGGTEYAFEGGSGSSVVRLDPTTGEVLATIEVGDYLGGLLEHRGWIWAVDTFGEDGEGAQLYRIDPATNTVASKTSVGKGTTGSVTLIAAGDHVLAQNSEDDILYAIDARTGEGDFFVTGPGLALGVR
ncbi:MAG: PQQ-binding-like beta-propeller repeat protein [Chloroflexi bacterium]|nr:PQQ-binding-like beta-propeller repeat protein [Chloroflexota bacterium]MDA1145031.1 PQQ-binding-like beta-propeller repeat protein [Chloroflexota bacterium]